MEMPQLPDPPDSDPPQESPIDDVSDPPVTDAPEEYKLDD
jgi:hypothetical protein